LEAKKEYLAYLEEANKPAPEPTDVSNLSGRVTFRMPKTLRSRVLERADFEGVSINQLLNEAVTRYVDYKDVRDMLASVQDDTRTLMENWLSKLYLVNIEDIPEDYEQEVPTSYILNEDDDNSYPQLS